jgi:hypothetical protein
MKRTVLLLASYCGGENDECTEELPCLDCLKMCNVVEIEGEITNNLGGYDYNKSNTPVMPPVSRTA